jgi:hypothetical protein
MRRSEILKVCTFLGKVMRFQKRDAPLPRPSGSQDEVII